MAGGTVSCAHMICRNKKCIGICVLTPIFLIDSSCLQLALSHHFLRLLHVWPLRFGVTWLFGQLFRLLSDEFQLTHQDLMRQVRLMQSSLSRKHLVQLSPLPASPSSSSSASSLSILSSRDRSWAQSLSRALAPSMLLSPLSSSAAPTPLSSKRTQNPNTSDHSTRTTGKGNDRAAGQINEEHTCLHTGLLHRLRLLLVSVLFQNSLYDRSFSFYSIARARPCMLAELHSHLRRTKHNLAYLYETMEGQQRAERNERRDQNKQQQEEKEEGEENTNVYEEVEADRSGEPSPVKKRRTGEGRGKGGIERMDNAAKANIDDLASVSPRVLLLLGERSGFRPTNPGFIYSKTIQEYFSFTKQNTVPTSPTSPIEGVKVEMVVKDLKGCTHLMPLERPYETARAITTYLSTTSTTSPKIMMRGTKTKSAQVATNTKAVEPLATSNETGQSPRPAIGEAGSVSAANGSTSNLSREGAVSAWNEGTAASGDSRTHSRNRNRNCSHSNIDSPSSKHIHDDSLNLYDNLPSFDSQSFSVRLSDISTAPSLVSSESINSTTSPSSGANGVDGHGGDQSAMLRASLQSIAETNSGAAVSPSSTTMAFSSSLSHSSSLCWSPPSSPTEYEDTHSLNGSVASDSDSSMASPTHTPSKERKRKQKRAKHKSKYRAGLLRLSIEPELARIAGYCKSLDADDLEVEVLVDECRKQWLQIDSDHSGIITLDELKRAIWARDPANASLPVPDQLPVDLQFHVEEMKSIIGKANNIYLCDFFNWVLSVWDGRDDIRVPHRKLEFELDIDGGRRGSSSPGRLQNDRSARIHGIQYRADKHRSKKHHKRNVTMMV